MKLSEEGAFDKAPGKGMVKAGRKAAKSKAEGGDDDMSLQLDLT